MLKRPRGSMIVWGLLLLPAGVVGGTSLTMWKMRAEEAARTAAQQLLDERDQARKSEAVVRKQLEKALEARQVITEERDRALVSEKESLRLQEDTKAVLAFLQRKVLSAPGRPTSWSHEGMGNKVTLLQAVDAAEAKVARAYSDRPLVEASIREILGATCLELGEPKRAIQQYGRALKLREAMLGPDDSATCDCRNKLAVAYRLAGRTDEAGHLFNQKPNSSCHATDLAIQGALPAGKKASSPSSESRRSP